MIRIVLIFLLSSLFFNVFAQDSVAVQQQKPKIGLVLSGGGAKGLAHIGVLKVLEEQGVEISYITGTSMGAIIGGLYSVGYSASQLDSIFRVVDSKALVQDYVPRKTKGFYERRDDEIYALQLPFDNFKIGIPPSLSKGMYNYNLLTRLTYHVRDVKDFSKLPIPFACVATEVATGNEVVLTQGDLVESIIASGAFPSLFSPVNIDGKVLIDGGIVNNYPVQLVRDMGADIVIGVDVQDDLKAVDDLGGAMGILLQTTNYPMVKQMENKRELTDIYIKPDITGYNVVSFDSGAEIIERGENAATELLPQIQAIANQHQVKQLPVQNMLHPTDPIYVAEIIVADSTLSKHNSDYVIGKLGFEPFSTINYSMFEDGISSLNATQNFSTITYDFENTPNNPEQVNVRLSLRESPVNRFLKFGVHYDGLYKSSALVNLTQRKLFLTNDTAVLDVILGDNNRYNFRYYWDNGFSWSVGFNSRLNNFTNNIAYDINTLPGYENIDVSKVNYRYLDIINQVYVQSFFKNRYLISLGVEHRYIDLTTESLFNKKTRIDRNSYFNTFANFRYDSYDNKYFPTRGITFNGEYKNFFYSTDSQYDVQPFSLLRGDIGFAIPVSEKLTLKIESELGLMFGPHTLPFFDYVLGGYGFAQTYNFRQFYGYDFTSLVGNNYIKGLVTLDYAFYNRHHLNVSANFANIGNDIIKEAKMFTTPKYSGYALGYGYQTIIGPIEIKESWSPETNNFYTWVSVGFWF
ncbi:patatin-like phospholipase family protein [Flavobacterium agricola]|uniref:Patatin-like phospholipase family protein n=1 Tax=Flavobacterium agricola TaxID=2870839 RepID=A0ABY6M146_9FLAO|nr:patatin-like phospholipase family protein [Flavobacterium agricola]UYW01135.1 patatin-like phospholipase family protein [Flavobacterium agricola]